MKILTLLILVACLTGCTTVKRNGGQTSVQSVDYPKIGVVSTAYIGENLVEKGMIIEETVLVVYTDINRAYTIPAGTYPQIGYDTKDDFFSAAGVTKNAFVDPVSALALGKKSGSRLRVITVFGGSASYDGQYEKKKVSSERGNSFQQTLIYNGHVGNKINVGYREYSGSFARPAFNNEVEYDLSASKIIGYKGARLEVIKADNTSITYKLLKNFN